MFRLPDFVRTVPNPKLHCVESLYPVGGGGGALIPPDSDNALGIWRGFSAVDPDPDAENVNERISKYDEEN